MWAGLEKNVFFKNPFKIIFGVNYTFKKTMQLLKICLQNIGRQFEKVFWISK